MSYKVRCFDGEDAAGMVKYTANLDYWDGRNWTCGEVGKHLGLGKTKDGRFYVCRGTDWQGEYDYAEIISEEDAKKLCLKHNPDIYEDVFNETPPEL